MTQEEKQILLVDLCGRLPYGVKVWAYGYKEPLTVYSITVVEDKYFVHCVHTSGFFKIEEVRPYLRPMSSMTKKEKKEYLCHRAHNLPWGIVAWLDSKHFDHRTNDEGQTLIEATLALEAPEGMYKMEE